MTELKLAIFYGSWLLFPLALASAYQVCKGPRRWVAALGTGVWLLGIWARFIEPQWIRTEHAHIDLGLPQPLTIALISDTHLGLFKSSAFLARVVEEVNAAQPAALFIAGDLTYEPPDDLVTLFAPLRELKIPAYYVPGNHDERAPGPYVRPTLAAALASHGVQSLEDRTIALGGLTFAGLGDLWGGRLDWAVLRRAQSPVVLLMHNPDSLLRLPPVAATKVKLALAGHTHCGQVRVPWLYQRMIPTTGPFDCGWHAVEGLPLFITPGTGEIGLPLRWLNPPTVSVLLID
ncbi:MAG: hypothetical protein EXR77_04075 [Myxococcales bacterium]|nr:hypothetical protein [Myxococcales bacterium]